MCMPSVLCAFDRIALFLYMWFPDPSIGSYNFEKSHPSLHVMIGGSPQHTPVTAHFMGGEGIPPIKCVCAVSALCFGIIVKFLYIGFPDPR